MAKIYHLLFLPPILVLMILLLTIVLSPTPVAAHGKLFLGFWKVLPPLNLELLRSLLNFYFWRPRVDYLQSRPNPPKTVPKQLETLLGMSVAYAEAASCQLRGW